MEVGLVLFFKEPYEFLTSSVNGFGPVKPGFNVLNMLEIRC